ncbi:hypothetical protein Bp8pS_271 [Bacillus phage vB_BpuM-BpSp]|nr:hypothetical protein Bp8pS_271 [Bacillus phage vB_BpuM-BpSp]
MSNVEDKFLTSVLINENSSWTQYRLSVLSEEKKSAMTDKLVTKLFNDVKTKSLSVDFTPVSKSKGDITKIDNFKALEDASTFLNRIVTTDPNKIKNVPDLKIASNEINTAIENIKRNKEGFKHAFDFNNIIGIFIYNSISVSLIQATSFVIAESVEYAKGNYEMMLKKSNNISKNNHLKAIMSFNEMVKNNHLKKIFKDLPSSNPLNEGLVSEIKDVYTDVSGRIKNLPGFVRKTIAILGIAGFALTFVRASVYFYYDSRVRLSQYLNYLKEFTLMNASTVDPNAKKVIARQEKIAKNLEKLADIISVDQNVANNKSASEIEISNKNLAIESQKSTDSVDNLVGNLF